MKKTLIITVLALGLGFLSTPSFAAGYIVNGHAASTDEVQHLVSNGIQPGAWVVNGFGISAAGGVQQAVTHSKQPNKNCRYVLDVLLCD